MPKSITERHEIVVESNESIFVFTADSRDGRLVIRQKKKEARGPGREVCALTLADPEELEAFFEGLRRVLSSTGLCAAQSADAERPVPSRHSAPRSVVPKNAQGAADSRTDRDEVVARARGRNAKAFEPWTGPEESDVRRQFEAGETVQSIARAHNRSPKAIQMRLERLGLGARP
jgi:hypothetical protein